MTWVGGRPPLGRCREGVSFACCLLFVCCLMDLSLAECHTRRKLSAEQISSLMNQIMITSAEVAARAKWSPIKITGGVFADEAMRLLRK